MTWNFRRRIKITPGFHLNVSKKGVSTTIGIRGASITTGKNGTYLNTSVPGTGIYKRQKLNTTNHNTISNNSGCLAKGGLISTWILLIFIDLYVLALNFICGIVFSFVIIITKVWTKKHSKHTENGTTKSDNNLAENTISITKNYFDDITIAIEKILDFCKSLTNDANFLNVCRTIYSELEISHDDNETENAIQRLFLADVTKCFIDLNHALDFKTQEGFGLFYFYCRVYGIQDFEFDNIGGLMSNESLNRSVQNMIQNIGTFIKKTLPSNSAFYIESILNDYDSDLKQQYLILLYRYTSLTAKADGQITDDEQKWLSELLKLNNEYKKGSTFPKLDYLDKLNESEPLDALFEDVAKFVISSQQASTSSIQRQFKLGYNRAGRIVDQLEEARIIGPLEHNTRSILISSPEELDTILQYISSNTRQDAPLPKLENLPETHITTPVKRTLPTSNFQSKLKSLVGLVSVKNEIETLTNFIKIQQHREINGLKTSSVSYHCVFTGNPGTGKTTVARIVADIYKRLGILSKGHLVETDRSGLVAEYVGQTAVKTNKIIDSALDGVLFIDEAYSLISDSQNDYGKEAIATLLKRMEDDRNRLVVILAGYTDEMKKFIDSNPGLQSRFNQYIEFPDYTAKELLKIFKKTAQSYDYKISKEAENSLENYLETKVSHKDKNFGNARFVRNLFEKTIERQANRLSKDMELTNDKLSEILTEDIPL